MSVRENLESYKVPQLRIIIKEHNKKVNKFIKEEVAEIKEKFKKEKLIKVTGIKDKNKIIDEMMKHEQHFKNVPFKVAVSQEEQNQFLNNVMQPALNKLYKEYKADGDLDELEDGITKIYKLAKSKELKVFQSKKKMLAEIKKDVAEEKAKEKGKPPRPTKPPLFIFDKKSQKLVLVSLFEARKLRPKKPAREAPKGKLEGTHEMKEGGDLMTGETHSEKSKPLVVITEDKTKPQAGGKSKEETRKRIKKLEKEKKEEQNQKTETKNLRLNLSDRFGKKSDSNIEKKKKQDGGNQLKELKRKLKKLGLPSMALKFIKTVDQAKDKLKELEEEEPDDKSIQVSPEILKMASLANQPKVKKLVLRILPREEYTIKDQEEYFESLKKVGEDWFKTPNARQKYGSYDEDEKALFELLYPKLFDKKTLRESGEAQREKRKEEKKAAKEKNK